MSAQSVGSIAVKAIMRVIGTIPGALVGAWLVGDYTSPPAIFLSVLFLVMGIASYKFGEFGARQVPYAYFCPVSPRLPSLPMGSQIQHKHGRSDSTGAEKILVGIMSYQKESFHR